MSQIPIEKIVYDKNKFNTVVNTQFNQLINNQPVDNENFTIEDFFELYEQFFYRIQKEGEINSHRFILEKEAEYLGVIINQEDIQALLNEITTLRQELLDTQTTLNELSKTTGIKI